ncbi:class I SAM-dependent methyltransferase [Actinomycetospora sp. C-140]
MDDPYEVLAEAYEAHTAVAPYNALYERPALLALLGDVTGRDVLDLGSGPGVLAAAMVDAGARVTGLERSAAMVRIATARLGDRAVVHRHDLTEPLPVGHASADVVVAGLVLHYLGDWAPLLAEVRRVLRPGGRFVASVHHPFADRRVRTLEERGPYLESHTLAERWSMDGHAAIVRFWHHPLGRMAGWITGAGLELTDLVEPRPVPEMATTHPEVFARLSDEPAFLLVEARVPG